MKVLIRILKIPAYILTFILIAIVLFALAIHFGMQMDPYIVLSGSMEPEIHVGSIAIADHDTSSVQVGDIIVYRLTDGKNKSVSYVTHRVTKITNDNYITKGDANGVPDAKAVVPKQVVGHYRFSIPYLGYLYEDLGKKGLLATVFAVPVLWILISVLEWGFATKENENEQADPQT